MGIRSTDYPVEYSDVPEGEVTVADMVNLHQLLEDIKTTDYRIEELRTKRAKMLEHYYTERDKLDAHHEMVVNKPMADPGPTTGRY